MSFGFDRSHRSSNRSQEKYFVVPRPRQRQVNSQPDEWVVKKGPHDAGANTVQTFKNKLKAQERAKELARKNNTVATVFDAAKKGSQTFNYS